MVYEDYVTRPNSRRNKTSLKSLAALTVIIFSLGGLVIGKLFVPQTESGITSPLSSKTTPSVKGVFTNPLAYLFTKIKPIMTEESLLKTIKEMVSQEQGFYSVYIYDITKGTGFGINETTILTAASVNKIPILAALYYLAQNEEIDLDQKITLQESDIQDFGTGILRNEGPGGVYSLKTIAQLLIKKSDNTAGYILGEQMIGFPKIQELVESWGMTQTNIVQNKTSVKDIALLLTKMYRGQIANQGLTQEMLGFMKDTDFENRLPRDIPKTVPVYHKIGNEVGNIHDVGIIALPDKPYYIGVMTNDIIDQEKTEDVIARISKVVFDFYNQESSATK